MSANDDWPLVMRVGQAALESEIVWILAFKQVPDRWTSSSSAARVATDEVQRSGTCATVVVSDTGQGMNEATRERMFEPCFTTKEAGRGTGLGLSTVFGIVRQSRGGIWVYSELGQGATFKVYFPTTGDALSPPAEISSPAATRESGTVLVVEDCDGLRGMVVRALRRSGLEVLEAEAPHAAIELLSAYQDRILVLLTDVLMPGRTGRQLAEQVTLQRPRTTVLYMSGKTENSIVHHGVLDEGVHFLPKPVTPARLISVVHGLLRSLRESGEPSGDG